MRQSGEDRLAPIESLRALAALAVLLGHVAGEAYDFRPELQAEDLAQRAALGGTFGVSLFFALSGYLLYLPFARRDFGRPRQIDLSRYALNRVLRIMPLYYASVAVVLVLQEAGGTGSQWWRFLLFAENFSRSTVGEVNPVLWSIVVELHFYALLPLVAFVVARFAAGSRQTAGSFLCLLAAASYLLYGLSDDIRWRASLPALFYLFVAGMLLALLHVSWDERRPKWLRGPLTSSAAWFALSVPIWLAVAWRHELAALTAVAGFLVVGGVVLPLEPGRLRTALACRPLALVGVASYSLYVWHLPILERVGGAGDIDGGFGPLLAVTLPLSLVAAFASYLVIESPFLRLRRRWGATASEGVT